MKRPMVWVTLCFMAGLYVAGMGCFTGVWGPFLLLAAAPALAWFMPSRLLRDTLFIGAVFFAVGALVWVARHAGPPGDPLSRFSLAHPDTEFVIEGAVRESGLLLPESQYARFVLSADQVWVGDTPRDLSGGVIVRWQNADGPVHAGERLRVRGRLTHALGPVNFGVNGLEDYYRARGICSELRADKADVTRCGARLWSPYYWASRIRNWEARALARAVPESVQPFVWTVWLGDSGRIGFEEYDSYIRSGTAHILSVSGVHIGILYVAVNFVLFVFVRSARWRAGILIGAVMLFALTAGARVACLRSAIMVALYLAADLVERERDTPTALSLSALALLLINPGNLFDTGFLLSFFSVASILIFFEPMTQWMAFLPWMLRTNVAVTLSAPPGRLDVA